MFDTRISSFPEYQNYDFAPIQGTVLKSDTDNYEISNFLGRGSFGQVVQCLKRSSLTYVAVKITPKNYPEDDELGNNEMDILATLKSSLAHEFNIVHTVDSFYYRNYTCFAFELLDQNLTDFLNNRLLSAKSLAHILQQLITALWKLKQIGIIHTDIKPDNIMIVDSNRLPYRAKIIDFGLAIKTCETDDWENLCVLFYRPPELLLNLSYGVEIDMWSLGCSAAEFFLDMLYPGNHEFDQFRYICRHQGLPPRAMLDSSSKTSDFFKPIKNGWRLKNPVEYESDTGFKCERLLKPVLNLDDISDVSIPVGLNSEELFEEKSVRKKIVHLITRMLHLDPAKRITPAEALNHPAVRDFSPFN